MLHFVNFLSKDDESRMPGVIDTLLELAQNAHVESDQLVKSVASKMGDDAGDGTTTATVLAQAILTEGMKNIAAGANPLDVKRGIDKAVSKVVESIKNQAEQVEESYEKIEQVATISANNDSEIGKLIADGMRAVSVNGVITIEDAKVSHILSGLGVFMKSCWEAITLTPLSCKDAIRDSACSRSKYSTSHRSITPVSATLHKRSERSLSSILA